MSQYGRVKDLIKLGTTLGGAGSWKKMNDEGVVGRLFLT